MTTPRKLEEIASDLDDMSVTLEEIKEERETMGACSEKLDKVQVDIERAAAAIEKTLDHEAPEQ